MTTLIGTLPSILTNGTTADATQVMADFNFIVSQVNANAAAAGANSDITSLTGLTTPLATTRGGTGASVTGSVPLTNIGLPPYLKNYMAGGRVTFGSTSVSITPIVAVDASATVLMSLPAWSKLTSGAFAVGSGLNGMGNGLTIASSTWYHFHMVSTGSAFDTYIDTSATAANVPSGTSQPVRILSFRTDSATTNILNVIQDGNYFEWPSPIRDANNVNAPGTTAVSRILSVAPGLSGVVARAIYHVFNGGSTNQPALLVSDLAGTDNAATVSNAQVVAPALAGIQPSVNQQIDMPVNASAQVRTRFSYADTNVVLDIWTMGWLDPQARF